MRRLHAIAALGSISILVARPAWATSPACETAQIASSAPAREDTGSIPRNARLAFETTSGCRAAIEAELLDSEGRKVAAAFSQWDGGGYFFSLVPSQPLRAESSYRLVVTEGGQPAGDLRFSTSNEEYVPPESAKKSPALEIRSLTYQGQAINGAGGEYASALLQIVVKDLPRERLGIVHVLDTQRRALPGTFNRSVFTAGRESVEVSFSDFASPNVPKCFSAVYEDQAGTRSPLGVETCVTPASIPPSSSPPSAEPESGGCATMGASERPGGGLAAVGALGVLVSALARRRRVS